MNNKNRKGGPIRGIWLYVILFAGVLLGAWFFQNSGIFGDQSQVKEIGFSEFVEDLKNEKVQTVSVSEGSRRYEGQLKDSSYFITYAPTGYDMAIVSEGYLLPQAESGKLTIESIKPSPWASVISWIPTLLLVGIMIFFWMSFMGSGGGNKGMMNFGKNKAKIFKDGNTKVTFRDVAGLDEEKAELEEKELWRDCMEDTKAKLEAAPSCTIDDLMSGESRILVMVAVLARLMVHTAVAHTAIWERRAYLFAFFTHILVASNRDFDLPFPWHLDITSASYLRTGRTHTRQTNVVDGIVDGAFFDESERSLFIVFVAHYLARQSDAVRILDAILASSRMKAYFADQDSALAERRVKFLRTHFEGGS